MTNTATKNNTKAIWPGENFILAVKVMHGG
jgi:hypothetical protein